MKGLRIALPIGLLLWAGILGFASVFGQQEAAGFEWYRSDLLARIAELEVEMAPAPSDSTQEALIQEFLATPPPEVVSAVDSARLDSTLRVALVRIEEHVTSRLTVELTPGMAVTLGEKATGDRLCASWDGAGTVEIFFVEYDYTLPCITPEVVVTPLLSISILTMPPSTPTFVSVPPGWFLMAQALLEAERWR